MVSEILGVAIGVVFTFMLFALFLSATLEAISSAMKLRGRALRVALARLVDDPSAPVHHTGFGLVDAALAAWRARGAGPDPKGVSAQPAPDLVADAVDEAAPERHEASMADGDHRVLEPVQFGALFTHPLVGGATDKGMPSYVPDTNFTTALLHTLLTDASQATIPVLTERIARLPPGPVRTALESALLDARGDWNLLRDGINRWYTNAMDRLSGEYKRFSQLLTFLLGLLLAATFNIDAIALARQLYADPILREQLADQATLAVHKHAQADKVKVAASTPSGVEQTAVPGSPALSASAAAAAADAAYTQAITQWIKARDDLTRAVPGANTKAAVPELKDIPVHGLGWLMTALAGMLGAPFWFDLLQKLTNLRGTGPKPENAGAAAKESTT